MSDPPAKPRRLRFTLLNLLLLFAVVFQGLVIWQLSPLRRENRDLREQCGLLTVEDPSLIYVTQLPTVHPTRWEWRVHLPRGRNYVLNAANCVGQGESLPSSEGCLRPCRGGATIYLRVHASDGCLYADFHPVGRTVNGGSFVHPHNLTFKLLELSEANAAALDHIESAGSSAAHFRPLGAFHDVAPKPGGEELVLLVGYTSSHEGDCTPCPILVWLTPQP